MTENKELFESMAAYLQEKGYISKPQEEHENNPAEETAILQRAGLLPKK